MDFEKVKKNNKKLIFGGIYFISKYTVEKKII